MLAPGITLALALAATGCRVVEVPVPSAPVVSELSQPTDPIGNKEGGPEPLVLIIVGTEEEAEAIRDLEQRGRLWKVGRGFDVNVHALFDDEAEASFWNAFAGSENLRCSTPCREIAVLDLRAGLR